MKISNLTQNILTSLQISLEAKLLVRATGNAQFMLDVTSRRGKNFKQFWYLRPKSRTFQTTPVSSVRNILDSCIAWFSYKNRYIAKNIIRTNV